MYSAQMVSEEGRCAGDMDGLGSPRPRRSVSHPRSPKGTSDDFNTLQRIISMSAVDRRREQSLAAAADAAADGGGRRAADGLPHGQVHHGPETRPDAAKQAQFDKTQIEKVENEGGGGGGGATIIFRVSQSSSKDCERPAMQMKMLSGKMEQSFQNDQARHRVYKGIFREKTQLRR
jgi:hypothetical protein